MIGLDRARALADAVLMEGYALYPYRASAPKNRYRWTFGALAPRAWSEAGGCEPWWLEAQFLVAGVPRATAGELRCFQIERRRVEDAAGREVAMLDAGGALAVAWEEGVSRTVELALEPGERRFAFDGAERIEPHPAGRVVHARRAIEGRIAITCDPVAAGDGRPLARWTIRIEVTTPWDALGAPRDHALLGGIASTHLVIGVAGGELVSAIDPPAWARAAAARCASTGLYPALVGPPGRHDLMLIAPFILYDHAQLAPESAGDLCDATEIDELLVLRTRTMTDDEKRVARATDPRAAAIVDRADALPADRLARMHGATRGVRDGEMVPRGLAPGGKVRLRPSPHRRTDAQDALYAGRVATIAELRHDVDGTIFLAVTIDDDPAAELHGWYGRYHHYRLDEVEPVEETGG